MLVWEAPSTVSSNFLENLEKCPARFYSQAFKKDNLGFQKGNLGITQSTIKRTYTFPNNITST